MTLIIGYILVENSCRNARMPNDDAAVAFEARLWLELSVCLAAGWLVGGSSASHPPAVVARLSVEMSLLSAA